MERNKIKQDNHAGLRVQADPAVLRKILWAAVDIDKVTRDLCLYFDALYTQQAPQRLDETFLHACQQGDFSELPNFLAAGRPVDTQDAEGNTALMYAVQYGRADIVAQLIDLKANPELLNEHQFNALSMGLKLKNKQLCQMLFMASEAFLTELWEAVELGKFDILLQAIKDGLDQNSICGDKGETPLMQAISWGKVDLVKTLIQHGARLEDMDNQGNTVFDWARAHRQPKITEILKQSLHQQRMANVQKYLDQHQGGRTAEVKHDSKQSVVQGAAKTAVQTAHLAHAVPRAVFKIPEEVLRPPVPEALRAHLQAGQNRRFDIELPIPENLSPFPKGVSLQPGPIIPTPSSTQAKSKRTAMTARPKPRGI